MSIPVCLNLLNTEVNSGLSVLCVFHPERAHVTEVIKSRKRQFMW